MASKSESPEIQQATKELEEISKEIESPQVVETSSGENSSDEEIKSSNEDKTQDEESSSSESSDDEDSPTQKIKQKPRIYLDLDNTLLHAIPTRLFHKKYKDKASKRRIAESLSNIKVYDMKDDDESYYLVFERPGLQQFLDYLFSNFTVCVWTAATKDYAAFIIDKMLLSKPERKLDYVFVQYHCKKSKKRYGKRHPKELKMLIDHYKLPDMNDKNCIIIDDHPDVKSQQPHLCVTAPEWTIFDEDSIELKKDAMKDDFLSKVSKGLAEYLKEFQLKGEIDNPSEIITPKSSSIVLTT